ncbi:MAG TPA: hypothetical protein VG223_13815 [Solirubrobacteraceae bacterium]|jgi:hypothetical protein|nr:hypothetical protein [Solirubrobacteraceae bacterium]
MSSLLVDSRTLLAARERLGLLHDQLLGIRSTAGGFDGLLGGRALEGELQQFCVECHDDVLGLGAEVSAVMAALGAAAAAYARIEARLAARARPAAPSGSGVTTVGGPPRGSGSGTMTIDGDTVIVTTTSGPPAKPGSLRAGSGTTTIY